MRVLVHVHMRHAPACQTSEKHLHVRARARVRACSFRTVYICVLFCTAQSGDIRSCACSPPSMLLGEVVFACVVDIAKKSSHSVRKKSKRGPPAMSRARAWADGGLKTAEFSGSVARNGSRGGRRNQDLGSRATPRDARPGERRILPGQIIGPISARANQR